MRKIINIVIAFLLFAPLIYSQDKDFGLWTSIGIEKKLDKKVKMDLGIANRLKDDLNQRDESFADVGVSYRLADFAAGFGYRFTENPDQERDYRLSHRLVWQIRYRPDWERFSIDYRIRYQSRYFLFINSENGKIPESFLRNRLRVSYNIKTSDFEPFVSYEYFFRFNKMGTNQFERRRFKLGMEYIFNKDNRLGLEWLLHETFNITDPKKLYAIALAYKLEI